MNLDKTMLSYGTCILQYRTLSIQITVECSSNFSVCLMECSCPKEDTSITSEKYYNMLQLSYKLK